MVRIAKRRKIEMKTILVTGGTGFIGNCFCKLLLAERPEYSDF
jgi:FlaA1/EpsC-like NDP-sugar epimerase